MKINFYKNNLVLDIKGDIKKEKLLTKSLNDSFFYIEKKESYDLVMKNTNLEPFVLCSFDNEYEAVKAFRHIKRRYKQYIISGRITRSIKFLINPILIIVFILSINGAITNASIVMSNNYNTSGHNENIVNSDNTRYEENVITNNTQEKQSQLLDSLKSATNTGKFSVKLSTGHKNTIYVFSDPLCPYCQKIEPYLENASKEFNVEILPVSVIGQDQSVSIIEKILSTDNNNRKELWKSAINKEKLPDNITINDDVNMLLDANNMAFEMMGFNGTPTIISDKGYSIPQSLLKDLNALKQKLSDE
ncbi:thioredoxin fold domain-containing protein [Proteus mirabilis]